MRKGDSKNYCKRNYKRKLRNTNKHKRKNSINGSLKSLVSFNLARKNGINTKVDAAIFRDTSKDTVALRMQNTVYKKQKISRTSFDTINKFIGINYKSHCIICVLNFYNDDQEHKAIVTTYLHNCTAKDPNDSVQHAKQDCYKCADAILKEEEKWTKKGGDSDISMKFKELSEAIKFSVSYISFILTKKNYPKALSEEVYNSLLDYDVEFSNLYNF